MICGRCTVQLVLMLAACKSRADKLTFPLILAIGDGQIYYVKEGIADVR